MTTAHFVLPPAPTADLSDLVVDEHIDDIYTLILVRPAEDPHATRAALNAALAHQALNPDKWADEGQYVPLIGTLGAQPVLGLVAPEEIRSLAHAQTYLDSLNAAVQVLTFAMSSMDGTVHAFTHTLVFPVIRPDDGPQVLLLPLTADRHAQLSRQVRAAQTLSAHNFNVTDPYADLLITDPDPVQRHASSRITGYLPIYTCVAVTRERVEEGDHVLHAQHVQGQTNLHVTGESADSSNFSSPPYTTYTLTLETP